MHKAQPSLSIETRKQSKATRPEPSDQHAFERTTNRRRFQKALTPYPQESTQRPKEIRSRERQNCNLRPDRRDLQIG